MAADRKTAPNSSSWAADLGRTPHGASRVPLGHPGGAAKEAWSARKQRYLAALAEKPERSLEVSVADKLQNAETTLADLERIGVALWQAWQAAS